MPVLGISTKVASSRLVVSAIGIVRSDDGITPHPSLEFRVDLNEDQSQQLRALTNAVRPLLVDGLEAVVVATFDYTANQRIKDWVKNRLRAEGTLAAMARQHSPVVQILTGREMAALRGTSKEELAQAASDTLPDFDVSAVMAALVAEELVE